MGSDCLDFFAARIGFSSDSFSQAEWHDATAKREAAEKDWTEHGSNLGFNRRRTWIYRAKTGNLYNCSKIGTMKIGGLAKTSHSIHSIPEIFWIWTIQFDDFDPENCGQNHQEPSRQKSGRLDAAWDFLKGPNAAAHYRATGLEMDTSIHLSIYPFTVSIWLHLSNNLQSTAI